MEKQTAGRNVLGDFAPKFAELNDDVLFGEVWSEPDAADPMSKHQSGMVFPIGKPNDAAAKYFVGQSYLAPLSTEQVGIFNRPVR